MESIGIEGIINRINQIEAKFNNLEEEAPVSFQEILNKTQSNLEPANKEMPKAPNHFIPFSYNNFPFQGPVSFPLPFQANQLPFQTNELPFPVNQYISPMSNGMVSYKGYEMTQDTAMAFSRLESLIAQHFQGRGVTVTSTTGGQHTDPNHYSGKAVDFVIEGLTKEESLIVEELARQTGFKPYNEYIHSSPYKTGDHMHVDLVE